MKYFKQYVFWIKYTIFILLIYTTSRKATGAGYENKRFLGYK